MVKKNWFADNIFNFIWLLLIVLLLGGGYYAYVNGYIPLTRQEQPSDEQIVYIESVADVQNCRLNIAEMEITIGESITGTVWTSTPYVFCEIFSSRIGEDSWNKIFEGTTDSDGNLVNTDNVYVDGEFSILALCGSCRTNSEYLNILPVAPDEPLCTDSDGGMVYEVRGICESAVTMTGAQDSCETPDIIKEYFCVPDIGVCESVILPCPGPTICVNGACIPGP